MAAVISAPRPLVRTGVPRTSPPPGRAALSVVPARRRPSAPSPRRHRAAAVYRRRRLVAAAIALGVLVVAGQAGAALGGSSLAPVERRPQVVSVVVEPGDTLWSVAQRVAPDRDPREVVDAIAAARGTSTVMPGETLTWLDE